ncbi:sensor histidine kinase [Actinophytocola sp.]|uniref:sensor histidine kinase n=1 Tax=Actinophytocola sp. TaxID=1872138 RepID=UPI00389A3F13
MLTVWSWRPTAYLLSLLPVAAVAMVPVMTLGLPALLAIIAPISFVTRLVFVAVGLVVLFVGLPWVAFPLARVERRRLGLVEPGSGPRPRTYGYRDPMTWREVGYTVLLVTLGPLTTLPVLCLAVSPLVFLAVPILVTSEIGPVAMPFDSHVTLDDSFWYVLAGIVLAPAVPYLVTLLATGHALVARALLLGDERIAEVTRSRARLVNAFDAERRRIERDLHDGAQEKLVSLTLRLGMARLDVPADSPAHKEVVAAHEQAKNLMADLRELVQGIYPKVLTDRGLAAALEGLAARSGIAVTVHAPVPRLPPHVESTAYFVVAEALTNIGRHSGASTATVDAAVRNGVLVVAVADDGRGGAVPGSGLTGLADRVAVLAGTMTLSSPAGGPTVLRVELPCE